VVWTVRSFRLFEVVVDFGLGKDRPDWRVGMVVLGIERCEMVPGCFPVLGCCEAVMFS
jgi:hypothetical protein